MAKRNLDHELDRLYQLPLEEFTAARNALAKAGHADVRSVAKPPLAAWAVNQLHWQRRETYDALIASSEALRRTHKTVLAGRSGDLRGADKAHDTAVDTALKATLEILGEAGHPATESTRQGILNTLRALPSDDPPGRLARVLQPGGFEMLAGFSIAGGRGGAITVPKSRPAPQKKDAQPATAKGRAPSAKAKEAVAAATRALRAAEHAAKREEFEAARAAREAEKAERRVEEARAAFEAAREALEEAEAGVPAALRAREASARRAKQAEAAVGTARGRLETAEAQLDAS